MMAKANFKSCVLAAIATTLPLLSTGPAPAQAPTQIPPGVSMTMFPLKKEHGHQYFINQMGQQIVLPGDGVKGDDLSVYTGPYGGVWYIDKNSHPTQISAPTSGPNAGMPQSFPGGQGGYPAAAPQTVNNYNAPQSGSSSGGSALGTGIAAAAGAMGGAMLGTAMTGGYNQYPYAGNYHGVPYGAAMYHDAHNNPYYHGADGKPVYVNNSTTVNNEHFNNWQKQNDVYQKNVVNQDGGWHNQYNPQGQPREGEREGGLFHRDGGADGADGGGLRNGLRNREGRFGGRFRGGR